MSCPADRLGVIMPFEHKDSDSPLPFCFVSMCVMATSQHMEDSVVHNRKEIPFLN